MSSFVRITLDTLSPEIEIISPNYTTPQTEMEIVVQGNEELGPYQEFYLIDSLGVRHDFIFDHFGDHFVGRMFFTEVSFGIGTFYARVKDLVDNTSSLVSKAIEVIESEILTVESDYSVATPVSGFGYYELISDAIEPDNGSEFYIHGVETESIVHEITMEWSES